VETDGERDTIPMTLEIGLADKRPDKRQPNDEQIARVLIWCHAISRVDSAPIKNWQLCGVENAENTLKKEKKT
jgi:hypothetical protein